MDYPNVTVSNQKEEFIGIQRVKGCSNRPPQQKNVTLALRIQVILNNLLNHTFQKKFIKCKIVIIFLAVSCGHLKKTRLIGTFLRYPVESC